MTVRILKGDMRERLRELDQCSMDSCVTDPPYHLTSIVKRFGADNAAAVKSNGPTGVYARAASGFMGQTWDGGNVAADPDTWAEVYRVLKPGAHLIAFGGTRTYHRMACAIEDAGFEVRDMLQWLYGSGFPKSHDVAKAIDRAAGAEREIVGVKPGHEEFVGRKTVGHIDFKDGTAGFDRPWMHDTEARERYHLATAPATEEAARWQGWGTALKPACEPIVLARKPLSGKSVAANVQRWGTGAINIDGCRIATDDNLDGGAYAAEGKRQPLTGDERNGAALGMFQPGKTAERTYNQPEGRWPANVLHDGSEEVTAGFPETTSGELLPHHKKSGKGLGGSKTFEIRDRTGEPAAVYGDSGSAARFFYCAKADKQERGPSNNHPTVKPLDLMQYLCRLVTPKGGTVLDPFGGSGSTAIAANREGFACVLCELSQDYIGIAENRIKADAGMFAEVQIG